MIKEGDQVEFDISPEYTTRGTVTEVNAKHTDDEGGGYNQYVVDEEDEGIIWTLHRDGIKGVVGQDKPSFESYERAMRGM